MITEEEIENIKNDICVFRCKYADSCCEECNEIELLKKFTTELYKKVKQLETEKQNVMKDLEKLNNSLEKDGFVGYADDIQDILSYMKGEEK